MRAQYPAPNGVVGLVPLYIGYAFEVDGDDDVVRVVVDTTLGGFVLWLAAEQRRAVGRPARHDRRKP